MKDLLKYSFWLILVAIPSMLILGGVSYWLVPEEKFDDYADTVIQHNSVFDNPPYKTHFENDSVKITTVSFPSENPYIPGVTEVWRVNKLSGDSILCVKSCPNYFGTGIDSIPSIVNVFYRPDKGKLIVEGPTCPAGTIATYIVDAKTGRYICLPSNCGFIGYTNWNDYIIASSKQNDIDYDLILYYENIYVLDWNGNIISYSSTKDCVIEEALPFIHHEAGLEVNDVKLVGHKKISPQYKDDTFWGNRFECRYLSFTDTILQDLDSLVNASPKWTNDTGIYRFYDVDYEYGMFMTIDIDNRTHTGIITKGAFGNRLNAPK